MGYTYKSIVTGVLSPDYSANLEESLTDYVNEQEVRDWDCYKEQTSWSGDWGLTILPSMTRQSLLGLIVGY